MEEKHPYVSVDEDHDANLVGFQLGPDHSQTTSRVRSRDASTWLSKYEDGDNYLLRLVTCKDAEAGDAHRKMPVDAETYKHAVGNDSTYKGLLSSDTGGAVASIPASATFYIQTPRDGGPFCTFSLHQYGHYIRGMFLYSSPIYAPATLFESHTLLKVHNEWSWRGEHILNLPLAFLNTHARHSTADLSTLSADLSATEQLLAVPNTHLDPTANFQSAISRIHDIEQSLIKLRMRFAFEQTVLSTIETALASTTNTTNNRPYQYKDTLTEILSIPRGQMQTRAPQDSMLSQRIATARAMVFDSMQLRNQHETLQTRRINVEIATSSRRIAEATLRDAASMKTIAIMTMIFLPGTAVASFFSMTMFNWGESFGGDHVASSYLWVYFATAVPLTIFVVACWYVYQMRIRARPAVEPVETAV